eukprot:CAMPEP_0206571244 /NCGR_PEP_ID=MMETSP0325_2-20121206/27529_1 /ASSEMBLY_ACC=CAM_ASM_000347 /TAXON_ID=2866 /ORGANISM="Crypthecodinium cohnii, Strain Seligo" /LENGTH=76 /DNA_ID=CAMNT_0054075209 /DNA_START=582 /DNA_END=809 /DNA_ORIENTATION=-
MKEDSKEGGREEERRQDSKDGGASRQPGLENPEERENLKVKTSTWLPSPTLHAGLQRQVGSCFCRNAVNADNQDRQ